MVWPLAMTLRSSDRVQVTIPIAGAGADPEGMPFEVSGRTVAISRNGGAIVLNQRLSAQQEITLRRLDTGKETRARVLNRLGGQAPETIYGITFVNPAVDFWEVDFPQLSGTEEPLARLLLRCVVCGGLTVAHFDEIELQVFVQNHEISRFCKPCSATTIWRQASLNDKAQKPAVQAPTAGLPPIKPHEKRKHNRVRTNVQACVRQLGLPDEIVVCENLSRGGLCFRSSRRFAQGAEIEVALSYSEGSANIFVPARIVHVMESHGSFRCGVAYVPAMEKRREYDGRPCVVTRDP